MGVADLCGGRVRPEISRASLYRTHDAGSEFKKQPSHKVLTTSASSNAHQQAWCVAIPLNART
jgi:hypothetical protein